ncbi:polyprenyl synthetase family protein [Parvularcula sp. ZS-1/3]|uniref:Polyprenyl synthetase family protein n=1 Tax=Parvularcula mediterranea TaxID=2732508 RepID=A0A7Y3RK59_9PROT|nr:polyprenyl synthetase family protein [Parvularcula mediterranea]NNU15026.1 polyprenyl synthetase family protein [Parvularcula mediterranea]
MALAATKEAKTEGQAFPEVAAELKAALRSELDATNAVILDHLGSRVPLIPEVAKHLIGAGGKRLRPLITLAAAEIAGAGGENARYLAAAVELIHAATLLHDDVVDDSDLRRGFKTANVVFGNKESVLVGDFLFARAFELMVKTGQLPVLDLLSRASCTISEGEVLQLETQGNIDATEEMHLDVIRAKTAMLFEAAARAGAGSLGASPHAEKLGQFAENFGIAYQLVDDALDYGHGAQDLGKTIGDDFRERKMTMPVILAYRAARDDSERAYWRDAFANGSDDFDRAKALIDRDDIGAKALDHARGYAAQSAEALDGLPDHPLKDILRELALASAERPF